MATLSLRRELKLVDRSALSTSRKSDKFTVIHVRVDRTLWDRSLPPCEHQLMKYKWVRSSIDKVAQSSDKLLQRYIKV